MISKHVSLNWLFQRRTACGFLTQLIVISFAPALLASSPPWKNTGLVDTGITASGATITSSGEIFTATGGFGPTTCSAATLTLGNSSVQSSCVTKLTASGQRVFSVQIGGATVSSMVTDGSGNIIVAGSAGPNGTGFATTPGAYENMPPGSGDPILCALSGSDGHPLFCTFVDVDVEGLAVDSRGNTYIAGIGLTGTLYVEKVNSTGTGVAYLTNLALSPSSEFFPLAADATGNLYCLCIGLYELNSSGTVTGSIALTGEQPVALALDPSGNPEALLRDTADPGNLRLRKYNAGLSTLQFDTAFQAGLFSPLIMAVDSLGTADIVGATSSVNLMEVNPVQQCVTTLAGAAMNAFLVRIDSQGSLLQSTYLQESGDAPAAMIASTSGASVVLWNELSDVMTMTLAPSSATIALACGGNAASFSTMPLAPNEIASFFGTGIGPAAPISTAPDANGLYPTQAGGFQITFDGVPAPLLYASGGQVNLVTPGALSGKSTTQVCAVVNGTIVNCLSAPVQSTAPGIFSPGMFDATAPGIPPTPYAAALNQDGTVNSPQNPAAAGSIVSLFVTGLGSVTPSVPDGGITPVPIPSPDLKIGVSTCQYFYPDSCAFSGSGPALYAGPAPLEIEGLGQINVRLPPSSPGQIGQIFFSIVVTSLGCTQDCTVVESDSAAIWTH